MPLKTVGSGPSLDASSATSVPGIAFSEESAIIVVANREQRREMVRRRMFANLSSCSP